MQLLLITFPNVLVAHADEEQTNVEIFIVFKVAEVTHIQTYRQNKKHGIKCTYAERANTIRRLIK